MNTGIETYEAHEWTWMENYAAPDIRHTGKYIYFSDDRDELLELAKKILTKYNLRLARITNEDKMAKAGRGFGFSLYIFDKEPRFKYLMRNNADGRITFYRYWKGQTTGKLGTTAEEFKRSYPQKGEEIFLAN